MYARFKASPSAQVGIRDARRHWRSLLKKDVQNSGMKDGLPGYVVTSWNGLASRAGLPDPILRKLNKLIVTALEDPALQEKAQKLGIEMRGSTPEAMRERMTRDIVRWRGVIEKANLVPQ